MLTSARAGPNRPARCRSSRDDATATLTLRPATSSDGRFRVLRLHARGGLGAVFVALDAELNREVALKQIQDRHADRPESRSRFLLEAEVTGGLEHPGIVPVYGLGHDALGRPYYAMRFIKGDSLKDAIAAFHAAGGAGRDAGRRALELQKLLRRFLDVCNAIAYAHSRGVLHRDLKPGNVMVGNYGETLVVDWGLAKVLGKSDSDGEPTLRPPSASGTAETVAGSAIGTPQYMSPEQAAGDLARLGPASDVYSLGATLYCLLTGRPPFEGTEVGEVLRNVQRGDFPPPSAAKPDVPRPLEAVCLKAMARRPEDRYASVRALAEDVERWLADGPVSAYKEPLSARAARWARGHPRTTSGVTTGALMAAVALVAVAAVVTLSNRRLSTANRTISQQNIELSRTNAALEKARAEAVAQRDQARAVTGFLVESFRKPDPEREGREVTIAEVLDRASEEVAGREVSSAVQAVILNAIAESYAGLGLLDKAAATHERALALRRRVFGDEADETLESLNNASVVDILAGRHDKAIPTLERVVRLRRARLGDDHADTLIAMGNLATAYEHAGRHDQSAPILEQVVKARRARLGNEHCETLESIHNLAVVYAAAGKSDRSIALHEEALKGFRAALGDDHPQTANSRSALAVAHMHAGRFDRAIPLLEESLRVRGAKLSDDHPMTLVTRNNLAFAYKESGQLKRAESMFEQILKAQRAKLGDDHPDVLTTLNNLALTQQQAGRPDLAVPTLERVLKARRAKLGDDHPHTLGSMNNLAVALSQVGQADRAMGLHEEALRIQRVKLGEEHQDTLSSMSSVALGYAARGQYDRALSILEKVLAVRRARLGSDNPITLVTLNNLAVVAQRAGEVERSLPLYEEAMRLRRAKLGDDHPDTLVSMVNVAVGYGAAQRHSDAEALLRLAVEGYRRGNPRNDRVYAGTLVRLAECLNRQRRYTDAEAVLRECLAIPADRGLSRLTILNAQSALGDALVGQRRFAEAEPLLITAQNGIQAARNEIPLASRDTVVYEAAERLLKLYVAWGKPDEAARRRRSLPPEPRSLRQQRLQALDRAFPADPFVR